MRVDKARNEKVPRTVECGSAGRCFNAYARNSIVFYRTEVWRMSPVTTSTSCTFWMRRRAWLTFFVNFTA